MNERLHCHCGALAEYRLREAAPIYTVDFFTPDGAAITHCPVCRARLYDVLRGGPTEPPTQETPRHA